MTRSTSDIQQLIDDPDPHKRETAARQLRDKPGPAALKWLKHLLADDHPSVAYAAAMSILAIGGSEAANAIAPLLRSQHVSLRNTVVDLLARIGAPAIARAAQLLTDRDKDIRKFGVDVLQQMALPAAEGPLLQALLDENVNVAGAAAEALGACGGPAAVAHLIACLDREPWLRCAALRSLGAIGGDDALQAIIAVNLDAESMVLFSAVTALGRLGDIRGIDFLMRLLDCQNTMLEPAIMQAIESILQQTYANTIGRVQSQLPSEKLVAMLAGRHTESVRSAVGLLGMLRAEHAVPDMVRLFTQSNQHLLDDLEQALLRIRPRNAGPLLEIINRNDEPDSVKRTAVRIIGQIGRKEALQPLTDSFAAAGDGLKTDIIQAMAAIGGAQAVQAFEAWLADPGQAVRLACIAELEKMASPTSIDAILKRQHDPVAAVRQAAAQSLWRYPWDAYRHHIASLLQSEKPPILCFGLDMIPVAHGQAFAPDILRLARHADRTVAAAALRLAGTLAGDAAEALLLDALGHDDADVRLAAMRGLAAHATPRISRRLAAMAASDPEIWNRYEAVQTIGRLQLIAVQSQLLELLQTGPDIVKTAVLDVLAQWGDARHHAVIERYADDENPMVRDAAIDALTHINPKAAKR